jgi:hypothetical protein
LQFSLQAVSPETFGYTLVSIDAYGKFVGRTLRRPRLRWQDNIKTKLEGKGCEDVDCTHQAKDRHQWQAVVNTVMNLRLPLKVENFLSS